MSSLPDSTNLLANSSVRTHRHRRSQAISGDFDIVGLGLYSPSSFKPVTSSQSNNNGVDVDKQYTFDNEVDFLNKPSSGSFSFPNVKTPDLSKSGSPRHSSTISSPARRSSYFHPSTTLNSPIKLGIASHRRAKSSSSYTKTRFFATEDTHMFSENIPDAMIDLDEILNTNLHINDTTNTHKDSSIQQISTAEIFPPDDDFLASPFIKQPSSNPFVSSPYYNNVNSTPIFENPIEEQNCSIAEEDDRILDNDEVVDKYTDDAVGVLDSDDEFYLHPPPTGSIYVNNSANSSSTSLRGRPTNSATHLIEKTLSNSSKDSAGSINIMSIRNTTPPPVTQKRSGAKANRYQIFYDQSNRISNALKNSSSDSIHLFKIDSNGGSMTKELRILGHSSSLPSLKSSKRINTYHYPLPRFIEPRSTRVGSPPMASSPSQSSLRESTTVTEACTTDFLTFEDDKKPFEGEVTDIPNEKIEVNCVNESAIVSNVDLVQANKSKSETSRPNNQVRICSVKPISTSPISIQSDTSAGILSNTTTEITDHSSYASDALHGNTKQDSSNTIPLFDNSNKTWTLERMTTPSIIISSEADGTSSPSTDNTFKQDEQANNPKLETTSSMPELIYTNKYKSSRILEDTSITNEHLPTRSSPTKTTDQPARRPSPAEKSFLGATQIPTYNKFNSRLYDKGSFGKQIDPAAEDTSEKRSLSKSKVKSHIRSKSYSTDLTPKISQGSSVLLTDEAKGQKSKRRSLKLIGWFKKK